MKAAADLLASGLLVAALAALAGIILPNLSAILNALEGNRP